MHICPKTVAEYAGACRHCTPGISVTETINDYDGVTPEWEVRLDGTLEAICYSERTAGLVVALLKGKRR